MKKILLIPFSIIVSYILFYQYALYRDQQEVIKKTMGVYKIDLKKTDFTKFSEQEINQFKNLTLTFTKDSFRLNMQVPFLYDSSGYWIADHQYFEEMSNLFFDKNPQISNQFGRCCFKDSTMSLISAKPKERDKFVGEIYFKKIF